VVVLEQSYTNLTKWSPLYLDVVGAFADSDDADEVPALLSATLGQVADAKDAVKQIEAAVAAGTNPFTVGKVSTATAVEAAATQVSVPKHEATYTNLLTEVFGSRLWVANAPASLLPPSGSSISATSPEYALGHVLGAANQRDQLKAAVRAAVADSSLDEVTAKALTAWLNKDRDARVGAAAAAAVSASTSPAAKALNAEDFTFKSNWIIGSEAWSHDLGASGLHHALSTGADVNLLLIDSTPYELPSADKAAPSQRRKDAGLYAMTYGNAYVASVAVYGDFAQTLRAFSEADAYPGPSVVLAYLPAASDETRALEVLKATKKAIEIGTWPLYRWDPSADARGKDVFELDSEKIKADLRTFLDRQNHLTELSARLPSFGEALESGAGTAMVAAQKRKAKAAFEALSGALEGPPLLVLFASDGGNAEKLAKKFTTRARVRGVAARALALDDLPVEDLPLEENVAIFTSVAGQGEFPQNGRESLYLCFSRVLLNCFTY